MSGALLLIAVQLCAGQVDDAGVDAGAAAPKMDIEEFGAPSGSPMSIDSFDASPGDAGVPSDVGFFQNNASPSNTRLYGFFRGLGAVDTSFDSFRDDPLPENVAELRARAHIGADVKFSEALRAKLEARAIYRAVTQRGWQRPKATLEPMIGDAFVDLYTQKVDLRVGWQIVSFGANPVFAPADQLNPRDFRESLLLAEPEDLKLPNFAVRANFNIGKAEVTAAYFPFFEPDRYNVFGQDEAFLQPDFGQALPFKVDPSIEDQLQPRVLETQRPKAYPWEGDLGLRATTKVNEVTVGASWVWGYEKIPEVTLDPELARVLSDRAAGRPPNEAASLSVQNRFNAGEQLAHGRYQRQHVLSLEASTLFKSAQIDADLSYTPAQTLIDDQFNPVRLSTVTWVLGVTQAADSDLLYNVTYIGMAIPGVSADQLLLILEPSTARGAPRTAFLHGVIGTVGYRFLDRKLEATVRGAVEYRGFAVAPRVTYAFTERITGILEAEIYEGKKYSPFGYFDRNDQILAGVQLALF
ncbi:MAG: DUF1302 family protein [Myxococcaceae bacterium]